MAKDRTQYNFNGKEELSKRKLSKEIVEKYLLDNPSTPYLKLQEIFNIKSSSGPKMIFNEKDYMNHRLGTKDTQERYTPIYNHNEKLYIANNWSSTTIKRLIEKAKNEFGYSIEELKSGEKNSTINVVSSKNLTKLVKNIGNLTFPHKNILLKGVPGTGKSRAIENIINKKLGLEEHKENVLRVNIHSASSNADLMQGIGISSKDGQIEYKEKQGLILNLIQRATFNPNQPFVLVLEEIQENSLNELIGDLIYLIEESKRAKNLVADDKEYSYEVLVEKIIADNSQTDYVKIPYLVNESTAYRKMIMPHNLYIFCTSNYRDDKKVIEDNLLRRFEVLEIYPKVDVVSDYCKGFFSQLNENILKVMSDEIHPDRFLIGHSNWIDVETDEAFYRAFLKVVVEFKDIKEVEFADFKEIVEKLPLVEELNFNSYKDLISDLQSKDKAGYDFLD